MLAIPARVIATSFALTCFAGTVCYGMYNGNGYLSIMLSAALVGLIALIVGMIVGSIALRGVNEYIKGHRETNPIPENSEVGQKDHANMAAG